MDTADENSMTTGNMDVNSPCELDETINQMAQCPPPASLPPVVEKTAAVDPEATDDPAAVCVKVFLHLLQDPFKMCTLLKLTNATSKKTRKTDKELERQLDPRLPQIITSLKTAFSNREVLTRAARHFQNIEDEQLHNLRSMMAGFKDIDLVVERFITDTKCSNPESLKNLINYMSDLIAETVPRRYRLDRLKDMTRAELEKAEKLVSKFDGDYNSKDWLAVLSKYVRGGVNQIFDSSNITMSVVLREFAAQFKTKTIQDAFLCTQNSTNFRVSDSEYLRAVEVADVPNYEKIYNFLSAITGCRIINNKDLSSTDAAIIANIFQEMEEVIATNFEDVARQMPILRAHIEKMEPSPMTKFDAEDVNDVEFNVFHLPTELTNMYEFEMSRRGVSNDGTTTAAEQEFCQIVEGGALEDDQEQAAKPISPIVTIENDQGGKVELMQL